MVKLPTVDQMISLVRKPGASPTAGTHRDARLRDAFDQSPVGIALASTDGAWLQYNERFRQLLGYTREQLIRLTLNDLTHPDDASREASLMRRMLAGEAAGYRMTKRVMDKRGKYREVEFSCALGGASDGAPYLIYVIDERARAATSTRPPSHGAEQILAVFDQLTDLAIIRTDDAGIIGGWNAGAERIFGYRREQIVGRPRRMLYRDQEHWAGVSTQQLKTAGESGRLDLEDWRVTRDGRHLWVRTTLTPVRIEGTVKGFIEVIRTLEARSDLDIVEALREEVNKHARTEETLRSTIGELRTSAAQTMNELKIMTDALRKELERRKRAEDELRAIQQHVSRAMLPKAAPPESEIVSRTTPPRREWKSAGDVRMTEVLVRVASQHKTGRLVITSGTREKELFVDDGHVISCSSNDPSRFLAQRLIASGMILEEQRQKALDIQTETHLALGRILVILGALTENQLHETLRHKAEEEIAELSTWLDAKYAFVEEAIPTLQLVPLRIDVAELVVQQLESRGDPRGIDDHALRAIDVTRIVDEVVSDLVMDDIASAADEITSNITAVISSAEIVIASASGKTKRFHRASCATAKRFADETRVVFLSAEAATAAGYDACRVCFR